MRRFITLEGPEGCGKTTQARLLTEALRRRKLDVLLTREPGGTPIGDQIRHILLAPETVGMTAETEFLLFSASRAQLVREVIRPHLERDGVVVCDRFADSSLAYQGYGRGLSLEVIRAVTRLATGGLRPDLTLLLDLPVEQGLDRHRSKPLWDRLDADDLAFHERVRQGYLELASAEPQRWRVIDASTIAEAVHQAILEAVDAFLPS